MRASIRVTKGALAGAILLFGSSASLAAPTVQAWTDVGPTSTVEVSMGGADPNILLVRRAEADPLRSADGGRTWTPFTVQGTRPDRFVASAIDSSRFYALRARFIDGRAGTRTEPGTLHRSNDGGRTWELVQARFEGGGGPLGNLRPGASPNVLYASRMAPGSCFVNCFYDGVEAFRSLDGGATW